MISRLAEGGPELLARRVTDGPLTLVHGDANSMNLVVPRDTEKGQALILDWATYAQSFGPDDVATYLAPFWYPRLRRQLEIPALQAYHRGLLEGGVQDYTWDSCWDDYRLGIVSRMLYRLRQPPLADHIGLWILENTLAAFEELDCAELLG